VNHASRPTNRHRPAIKLLGNDLARNARFVPRVEHQHRARSHSRCFRAGALPIGNMTRRVTKHHESECVLLERQRIGNTLRDRKTLTAQRRERRFVRVKTTHVDAGGGCGTQKLPRTRTRLQHPCRIQGHDFSKEALAIFRLGA
jgi:hypothetical protein